MLRRRICAGLLLLVTVGCAAHAPTAAPATAPVARSPAAVGPAPGVAEVQPPLTPAPVQPPPGRIIENYLRDTSPDGQWRASFRSAMASVTRELWISPVGNAQPNRIAAGLDGSAEQLALWSPQSTLLYYKSDDDSWQEADPATSTSKPFWAELLQGYAAGNLRFSPDGKQLLYTTPISYHHNQPRRYTETNYVLDLVTGQRTEVGVDVQARWDGGHVVAVPEPPWMMFFPYWARKNGQGEFALPRPAAIDVPLLGTDYAEWRIYPLDSPKDAAPLAVYPVRPGGSFLWPDPPDERVKLELWTEVRPDVPDAPEFRREGARRFKVLLGFRVNGEGDRLPPGSALLSDVQMESATVGWARGANTHLLRTTSGGATWRDVTPAGLAALDGRVRVVRQDELEPGGQAAVAAVQQVVGPDGRWTADFTRVLVFRTSDGGQRWQSAAVETGLRFATPVAITFVDADHGWLAVTQGDQGGLGDGGQFERPLIPGQLWRTADGGRSWQRVAVTGENLPQGGPVRFVTAEHGWLLGQADHVLYETRDGGRTWQRLVLPLDLAADERVAWRLPSFVGTQDGWVSAYAWRPRGSGRFVFFNSADGGTSWTQRFTRAGEGEPVWLTARAGWASMDSGRLVEWTHDSGQTWVQSPAGELGYAPQFFSPQEGWQVRWQPLGTLWHTLDGGATWTQLPSRLEK